MLALPTFVWSAVSRKCVGSLLVRVSVGLAGVEGGAAPKLMPPGMIALFPAIVLIIILEEHTSELQIHLKLVCRLLHQTNIDRVKFDVPAAVETSTSATFNY